MVNKKWCLCAVRCRTAAWWRWCPNRPRPTTSRPRPASPAPPSADTVSWSSTPPASVFGTAYAVHAARLSALAGSLAPSFHANVIVSPLRHIKMFCCFRYEQSRLLLSAQSSRQLCWIGAASLPQSARAGLEAQREKTCWFQTFSGR